MKTKNVRSETEDRKQRAKMKISFSYPFYVNPHPSCHYFSNFWSTSFSSPTASNMNAAVALRFFFILLRQKYLLYLFRLIVRLVL